MIIIVYSNIYTLVHAHKLYQIQIYACIYKCQNKHIKIVQNQISRDSRQMEDLYWNMNMNIWFYILLFNFSKSYENRNIHKIQYLNH